MERAQPPAAGDLGSWFGFLFWPWLVIPALLAWPVLGLAGGRRREGRREAGGPRRSWPFEVLLAPGLLIRQARAMGQWKLVAAVLLLLPLFLAVLASLVVPAPAWEPGRGIGSAQPPSLRHPLGTNGDGVDLAALVLHGCRNTYLVVSVTLVVVLGLGVPLGVLLDRPSWGRPLRALLAAVETVPLLVGMMVLVAFASLWIGDWVERGLVAARWISALRSLVVGAGIGLWLLVPVASLVAERIAYFRRRDFVDASLASGIPARRVIWYHVVYRNALPDILILATHLAGMAVLFETSLGYLFSIGTAKLGRGFYYSLAQLLTTQEARQAVLFLDSWWLFAGPMIFIAVAILGFLVAGDGMAELVRGPGGNRRRSDEAAREPSEALPAPAEGDHEPS